MAKPIPLLRVSTLIPFVDFLEKLGTPTEKLLRQCKLPVFALDEPNNLIPRHQTFAFLEKAAYQEGIVNFGCLVAERTPLHSFGAFGRLVCQSLTLYDAIATVIHLANLFNSGERYWLLEQGEKAYLAQEYLNLAGIDPHYASHFSLMLMVDLIQRVAGKAWYPQEIWLQTNQVSALLDHSLSQVQINTQIGLTAIAFPRSFLALPLGGSVKLEQLQQQSDYQILQASAPFYTFAHSLGQALFTQLQEGYPSIHLAAEIAQMSIRTLQRRLAEENLTYSQLVDRLRYKMAVSLLQDSSLKMIEISEELGYEDPAHFTRAFKRWTGLSPRNFRLEGLKVT